MAASVSSVPSNGISAVAQALTASTAAPNAGVTVIDFLDVITHGQRDKAWVTFVPHIDGAPARDWFGGRLASPVHPGDLSNWYYSLGLIDGNQRTLDRWCGGTLVVLDDVGEKTSDDGLAVRDCLGDPTFVIQTSKGSQQWGYVLAAPVVDMTMMARLQRALTLKFYPARKDPGHERVIQYLRLPCGVNNKPKRCAENGGNPWPVRLVEWRPDVRVDALDLMMALGDAWDQTENLNLSAGNGLSGPGTEAEARTYEDGDVVLKGLDQLNMVRWGDVRNGYVGVTCPWHDQHTIQDDCEGYNPESRHYQCFHSTHGPKNRDDVVEWLRTSLGEEAWKDLTRDAMGSTFGALPEDQSIFVSASLPVVSRQPSRAALDLVPVAMSPPTTPLPMRRTICSHLARGEVTYRIGAPGVGKSAVSLSYALAVAANRPDLVGEKSFARTGDVVILSNEDTHEDYLKRIAGWKRHHGLTATDFKHEIYVNRQQDFCVVTRDDRYSPVKLHEDMTRWLSDSLKAMQSPCLIVVDTQAATFQNVEENDNGAMGRSMALLGSWSKEQDIAVEIIHHGQKANGRTEGAGKLTSARGAGAAGGSVRNATTVTGLNDKQMWELPVGEGETWLMEDGAKSNHGAVMRRKWWQRVIVDVAVEDRDEPTVARWQGVPVYVFRSKGPRIAHDPRDMDNIAEVLFAVAKADAAGDPLRVRRAKGAQGVIESAADVIAGARSWDVKDAEATLKAAEQRGMIRKDERQTAQRSPYSVWAVGEEGRGEIERREQVLETTDDSIDGASGEARV